MAKASDNVFPKLLIAESSAPANPAAGNQGLFIDSADHKLKRVNASGTVTTVEGGGGSTFSIGHAQASRTSGNVTLNSTTFVNIDTSMDLTLAAAVGDVIDLSLQARTDTAGTNVYCVLDFHTIVGGSPVNSCGADAAAGTTSTGGPAGWASGNVRSAVNGYTVLSGSKLYTVQSSDLSSGNVTFRLRGFSGGSVNLAASDPRLYVRALNLKQ